MLTRRICMKVLPAMALSGAVLTSSMAHAQEGGMWSNVQQEGALRCGTAVAPPYIMKDPATGDYTGFFVELCREFADVLQVEAEFVDTSWDNMVAGLQSQKFDLAMALTATPQRALAITFSKNVSDTESTFLFNNDNPKFTQPTGLEDFDKDNVTIAVTSGSAQDKLLTSVVNNASIMRLPGPDEIRLALMSKRADAIFDTSAANALFAANSERVAVVEPEPALNKKGVSFGLRRDTSPADLQVLDIFISNQIDSGHIDDLIKKAIEEAAQ